jgi:hypothetical protein
MRTIPYMIDTNYFRQLENMIGNLDSRAIVEINRVLCSWMTFVSADDHSCTLDTLWEHCLEESGHRHVLNRYLVLQDVTLVGMEADKRWVPRSKKVIFSMETEQLFMDMIDNAPFQIQRWVSELVIAMANTTTIDWEMFAECGLNLSKEETFYEMCCEFNIEMYNLISEDNDCGGD